jgi:hypothetical protein
MFPADRFCAGCGRPTGSVWAGWKRGCLPDTEAKTVDGEEKPPCVSKKGVHNFAYRECTLGRFIIIQTALQYTDIPLAVAYSPHGPCRNYGRPVTRQEADAPRQTEDLA